MKGWRRWNGLPFAAAKATSVFFQRSTSKGDTHHLRRRSRRSVATGLGGKSQDVCLQVSSRPYADAK